MKELLLAGHVWKAMPHHQSGSGRPSKTPGVPALQEEMGDPGDLRAVLHVQRDAMDPVQHHQQHRDALLWRGQLRHQLDQHDLHDHVHPAHLSGLLAAGPHQPEGVCHPGGAGHGCGQLDQGGLCGPRQVCAGVRGPERGGSVPGVHPQRACQAGGRVVRA